MAFDTVHVPTYSRDLGGSGRYAMGNQCQDNKLMPLWLSRFFKDTLYRQRLVSGV